jgi:hypothetical protein
VGWSRPKKTSEQLFTLGLWNIDTARGDSMLQMILIVAGLGTALIATIVILFEARLGRALAPQEAASRKYQSMQSKGRLSWRPLFRACTHRSAMSAYSPTAAQSPQRPTADSFSVSLEPHDIVWDLEVNAHRAEAAGRLR